MEKSDILIDLGLKWVSFWPKMFCTNIVLVEEHYDAVKLSICFLKFKKKIDPGHVRSSFLTSKYCQNNCLYE